MGRLPDYSGEAVGKSQDWSLDWSFRWVGILEEIKGEIQVYYLAYIASLTKCFSVTWSGRPEY